MKNIFNNQNGSTILYVLVVTLVIGIVSTYLNEQAITTIRQIHKPIVKTKMQQTESQIRNALYQPSTYDCTAGPGNCTINMAALNALLPVEREMPGCVPTLPVTAATCGLRFTNDATFPAPVFNAATSTFTGTIEYTGSEMNLRPVTISVVVPAQVLQQANFQCPDAQPLLTGFDAAGVPQCSPLPASCPGGQYMTGFGANPPTLVPVCQPYPGADLVCNSATEVIGNITFAGAAIGVTCLPRAPLWTFFNMDLFTTIILGPSL